MRKGWRRRSRKTDLCLVYNEKFQVVPGTFLLRMKKNAEYRNYGIRRTGTICMKIYGSDAWGLYRHAFLGERSDVYAHFR